MADLPPLQRREPIGVVTRGNRVEPAPSFVRYLESLTRNQNVVTRTVEIVAQPVEAPVPVMVESESPADRMVSVGDPMEADFGMVATEFPA